MLATRLFLLLLTCCLGFSQFTLGQTNQKVFISFTDKEGVQFDPYDYFDSKAIQRRVKHGIPLDTYSDLPVNEKYITALTPFIDSIKFTSRWLNGVFAYVQPHQITSIGALSKVKEVYSYISAQKVICTDSTDDYFYNENEFPIHKTVKAQLEVMHQNAFESRNIRGKGIRVAIFDVGFKNVNIHPAFAHIRKNKQIIKTYDFVKNREDVYKKGLHGTTVLSCVGGKTDSLQIGLATEAEFLLARTERSLWEPRSEEENWLAAAEWADKNGADIINSSLGYGKTRYFTHDMNGKESIVSKAANMAAAKGILICNSAGNEADNSWEKIITPADVDSVLTVGGVNPHTRIQTFFSSIGPTSDLKMKPNICAFGHVYAANETSFSITQGTSFSSPLLAGFAACALQANPTWTNMKLKEEIEKSGNLYPYFDYANGYGIPRASYFFENVKDSLISPFVIVESSDLVTISLKDSLYKKFIVETVIEEKDTLEMIQDYNDWATLKPYIFYHIQHPDGYLTNYYTLDIYDPTLLKFSHKSLPKGYTVHIHFMGHTSTYKSKL